MAIHVGVHVETMAGKTHNCCLTSPVSVCTDKKPLSASCLHHVFSGALPVLLGFGGLAVGGLGFGAFGAAGFGTGGACAAVWGGEGGSHAAISMAGGGAHSNQH